MDFWDFFWLLFIYLPLLLLWSFALVDVFRRDELRGISKALWVLLIVVLPWFGALIYLTCRPMTALSVEARDPQPDTYAPWPASSTADELATLADLHDRGKLDDAEFAAEKRRLLGTGTAA